MEEKYNEIEDLKKRVERLEAQMVFLHRRMGIEIEEKPRWQVSEKVMGFIRQGNNKDAIRAFMEETGASLKDAKQCIENVKC